MRIEQSSIFNPQGITMCKKTIMRIIFLNLMIMSLCSVPAFSGTLPAVGSILPEFKLETPGSEKERSYLGISGDEKSFSIDQAKYKLVLIEILGVYCPKCHIQHPVFNKLFHRIRKDPDMNKKIKMIGIAAGANPMEVEYLKKEYRIPYPIFKDPKFEIHKILGEPRTPFTMLVTSDKNIAFAHLGMIKDIDNFFLRMKKLVQ